jgi:hypothetical protein
MTVSSLSAKMLKKAIAARVNDSPERFKDVPVQQQDQTEEIEMASQAQPKKTSRSKRQAKGKKKIVHSSKFLLSSVDKSDSRVVKAKKLKIHSLVLERKVLQKKLEKIDKEKSEKQSYFDKLTNELSKFVSSSTYGNEIIWFSIIIGLVFDFLLWQDVFEGKFGVGPLVGQAERASAVLLSFSYAFVCSQVGVALNIFKLKKKRGRFSRKSSKEAEIYNKAVSRDSMGLWSTAFVLLTVLATAARFSEPDLLLIDRVILSLAAFAIGFVIIIVGYYYHDIYSHELRSAKNDLAKSNKLSNSCYAKLQRVENKIASLEFSLDPDTSFLKKLFSKL